MATMEISRLEAGQSAQDACDLIFHSVDQFCEGAVQYEDMALLAVKVEPAV